MTQSYPLNPAADAAGLGGFNRLHSPLLFFTLQYWCEPNVCNSLLIATDRRTYARLSCFNNL